MAPTGPPPFLRPWLDLGQPSGSGSLARTARWPESGSFWP
jgi:hypothetical protein